MPERHSRGSFFALILLIVGSLAAFGGVYRWAAIPIMLGSAAACLFVRPAVATAADFRALDLALLLFLTSGVVQMMPLPSALADGVSPRLDDLRRTLLLEYAGAPADSAGAVTLSINPADTAYSAGIAASAILLFWTCRHLFARHRAHVVLRAIAWTGFAASLVAIIQRATSPNLIYWWWRPAAESLPFGPFVNHNHFATWALMAAPLVTGYIVARLHSVDRGGRPRGPRWTLVHLTDARMIWLIAAASLMTLAVFVCISRSGLLGLGAAVVSWVVLTRRHADPRRLGLMIVYAIILAAVIVTYAQLPVVLQRFEQAVEPQDPRWGRSAIWEETLPVVQHFWLAGTGLGTYQTAMLVYQESDRTYYYNQAHNHYLQLAAEGGLLLVAPAVLAGLAFVRAARRRLSADDTAHYWIRAGAASGLAAVAMQSVWETGLRMPANAILFAVLAAFTVHAPRRPATPHHPS